MKSLKVAGFGYLLFIHLLLALMLWKSNFVEKIEARLGMSGPMLGFYERMTIVHKTMDGSIPRDSVLFIGDSITQSLATSAVSSHSINFGIGSDTTLGVLNRLPLYRSVERAGAIVLAIGINDIHQDIHRRDSLDNYRKILDSIPTRVPVIAASLIPIGLEVQRLDFSNTNILSLNSGIKDLTSQYSNVTYLDTHSKFTDDAGNLQHKLHVGDGVHLSDEGYAILMTALRNSLIAIR